MFYRFEHLQRLAEKVHRDCRTGEDHLDDIEKRILEVSVFGSFITCLLRVDEPVLHSDAYWALVGSSAVKLPFECRLIVSCKLLSKSFTVNDTSKTPVFKGQDSSFNVMRIAITQLMLTQRILCRRATG